MLIKKSLGADINLYSAAVGQGIGPAEKRNLLHTK